jgi:thiol-disulfide isomerase/thioredoxin/uncharacterized membrane protein YphA (DoxX/SURF4 family)
VDALPQAARLLLGAAFVVAGVAKLADRDGARRAVTGFGVPAQLRGIVAVGVPLVELAVAGLLLTPSTAVPGAACALALLGVFTAAIARTIAHAEEVECHCFGELGRSSAGWSALSRNVALMALALLVVAAGEPRAGPPAWLVGPVLVICVAGTLTRTVRSAGRASAALDPRTDGLSLGDPAPRFTLSGVDGREFGLAELLASGRQLMLVFADPDCGPCRALLPDLARWQASRRDRVHIVVVNRGPAPAELEQVATRGGLVMLFERDREVSKAYAAYATPSAVAVGPDGKIASRVASGAAQIRSLVGRVPGPTIELAAGAGEGGGGLPRRRVLAIAGAALATAILGERRRPAARAQGGPVTPGGPCQASEGKAGKWCVGPGDPPDAICLPSEAVCCPPTVPRRGIGGCRPGERCCHFPDGRPACCGCPEGRTPCGQNPGAPAGVPRSCCLPTETCCGSGQDVRCCPCPDTITNLDDCPNRVQRSPPTANGCGGADTSDFIRDFLDRFKEADFRPACNAHDICYGTCNRTQKQCDDEILRALESICRATFADVGGSEGPFMTDRDRRRICLNQAGKYHAVVRGEAGRKRYERAQRESCQCCPDPPDGRGGEGASPPPLPKPETPRSLTPQGNGLRVPVDCPGPADCAGNLRLSIVAAPQGSRRSGATAAARRRRRKVRLGQRAFQIRAGQRAEVNVRLSRKGRRLLKEQGRLTVLATARARLGDSRYVDTGLDSFVLRARRDRERR